MKTIKLATIGMLILIITSSVQAQISTSGLQEVPRENLPRFGTFWLAKGSTGNGHLPPLPCPPGDLDVPIYALPNGQFLVDDSEVDYEAMRSFSSSSFSAFAFSEDSPEPGASSVRNYQKFAGQTFSVIDTNTAATYDTDLYSACLGFGQDTNTLPTLQIARYGTNAVIIKANHFDYSAETRDFALVVSDALDRPLFKAVDLLGTSDAQDGWLIQGLISNWKVTSPMFMMVSNINLAYNAFYRAIPYSGPQVDLTGFNDYDTVSGIITLQAAIMDLSGTTNEKVVVLVDGLDARYTIGSSNSIDVDTRYAPNSSIYGQYTTVSIEVGNTSALISDPQIFVPETKSAYASTAEKTLDFENAECVVSSGDMCSTDVGTNYFMFGITHAQNISASIEDPSSGRTIKSFSGYVPYPAIVQLDWNFRETGGAPYTNEAYSVTFVAQGIPGTRPPAIPLTTTNHIPSGVRTPAGAILTYMEEDPSRTGGSYLNSEANKWVGAINFEYSSLYYNDFGSQSQYYQSDIGPNRNNGSGAGFPYVLTGNFQQGWANQTLLALTNHAYSDFNWYMGHGDGTAIGGGSSSAWVNRVINTQTVRPWRIGYGPNSRIRKVALWACYSDSPRFAADGPGLPPSWATAFGVLSTSQQSSGLMAKNVGLFFAGEFPQAGYSGTLGGTSPEVAITLDQAWIDGPYPFPGGCDPTYAFAWAVLQTRQISPEIDKGYPRWVGFGYLPYSGVYENEILTNNVSHLKIR